MDEYSDLQIDEENEHDEKAPKPKFRNKIGSHEVVQLSTNRIPKGLVPLENLFDHNYVSIKLENKEENSYVF